MKRQRYPKNLKEQLVREVQEVAFTERMRRTVAVVPLPPRPAVELARRRVALVALVPFCFLLGVFFAKPAVRQFRTAGVGTWPLRFVGHHFTSVIGGGKLTLYGG